MDTATGTIHLLSTWNLGTDAEGKIISGVSTDTRRVFVLTSTDDDGLTWSAAKDITATAKQPEWTWYATGPGAGIRLSRGAQAGRLIVPCDHILAGKKSSRLARHLLGRRREDLAYRRRGVLHRHGAPNENLCVELLPPAPATSAHQRPRPPGRRSSPAPSPRPTGASYSPAEFVDAHEFTTPTVQGGLASVAGGGRRRSRNRILFSCPNGSGCNRMSIWPAGRSPDLVGPETCLRGPPPTRHDPPDGWSHGPAV
ncbi:MAG: sialidase family protein [Kiritimatiellia bacterium]